MCCAVAVIPPPEEITPDTPLRLSIAAAPIADEELASVWAKLGTSWRNGAIIKRVL
jgi:hypothetical protein